MTEIPEDIGAVADKIADDWFDDKIYPGDMAGIIARAILAEREALAIFADYENWRQERRLDPNGSRFDGIGVARAALQPEEKT